jgi:hypothetical protein
MKLGRYRDAAEHWEYFLKNAPEDMGEARARAHEELAECRSHLGRARVIVNRDVPVQIVVDKKSPELRVGEDIWLDPGEHEFVIWADQAQSAPQRVMITAGTVQTIPFDVPSTEPSPTPKSPAPAPDAKRGDAPPAHDRQTSSSARTGVLITGAGLTAVGVGIGIFFTLKSNAAASDVDGLRSELAPTACAPSSERPPACDELRAKLEDWDASQNAAVGTFIAAGAFGAATLVTALVWPTNHEGSASPRGAARVSVAPWEFQGARGVEFRMGF